MGSPRETRPTFGDSATWGRRLRAVGMSAAGAATLVLLATFTFGDELSQEWSRPVAGSTLRRTTRLSLYGLKITDERVPQWVPSLGMGQLFLVGQRTRYEVFSCAFHPDLTSLGLMVCWPVGHYLCRRAARRDRSTAACRRCGYDLRASPDCCPECGSAVHGKAPAAAVQT